MVPRALVPVVLSLARDHLRPNQQGDGEERSLYADVGDGDEKRRRSATKMKSDARKLNALAVRLHGRHIGIINLVADRQFRALVSP
jgi:hypothetical protein